MFNPEHLIHRGKRRCVRCGMTRSEIHLYQVLLCPAGRSSITRRAHLHFQYKNGSYLGPQVSEPSEIVLVPR